MPFRITEMAPKQHDLAAWLDSMIGDGKAFQSNVAFAERVGIAEGTIRRLRLGGVPSIQTLDKIAEALPQYSAEGLRRKALDKSEEPEENKRQFYLEKLMDVFARLPPEDQQELLELALIKMRKQLSNDVISKLEPAAPETE